MQLVQIIAFIDEFQKIAARSSGSSLVPNLSDAPKMPNLPNQANLPKMPDPPKHLAFGQSGNQSTQTMASGPKLPSVKVPGLPKSGMSQAGSVRRT